MVVTPTCRKRNHSGGNHPSSWRHLALDRFEGRKNDVYEKNAYGKERVLSKEEKLTVGLEPTTSGLEVQCAIQLRHASSFGFLPSLSWDSLSIGEGGFALLLVTWMILGVDSSLYMSSNCNKQPHPFFRNRDGMDDCFSFLTSFSLLGLESTTSLHSLYARARSILSFSSIAFTERLSFKSITRYRISFSLSTTTHSTAQQRRLSFFSFLTSFNSLYPTTERKSAHILYSGKTASMFAIVESNTSSGR